VVDQVSDGRGVGYVVQWDAVSDVIANPEATVAQVDRFETAGDGDYSGLDGIAGARWLVFFACRRPG